MENNLRTFEALSDPTRLRILSLLAERGELCVCHIFESLEMSQPRVSRHLGVLRSAKLVNARRNGRWIYYSLHQVPLDNAIGSIRQILDKWDVHTEPAEVPVPLAVAAVTDESAPCEDCDC